MSSFMLFLICASYCTLSDFKLEELFPIIKHQGREFLCLPTKTEMEMEDGTVYHVNTYYGGSTEMGPLLDALTLEKIDRAG